MAKFTTSPPVKKQWLALMKKEERFISAQSKEQTISISDKIEDKIPDNLQEMMDIAFSKAFAIIFEKGTKAIELTYRKKWHKEDFDHHTEQISKRHNTSNLKAFSKKARETRSKNLIFSGIEGIGFGIVGAGIPDIPIFTAMILKGIYEVALSYGFSYEDEQERLFILKIIQASMTHGDTFRDIDKELNNWIHSERYFESSGSESKAPTGLNSDASVNRADRHKFKTSVDEQIRATSDSMSTELLITKFIQGVPVAGVVGGAYDMIYLNRITKYADLKYQRRFLFSKFQRVD